MKKIIILIIGILLAGSFIWIMAFKPTPKEKNTKEEISTAIIYFSATGTTKQIAEYIKGETNGDLIEIIPKEKYTDNDLNYGNNGSRATKEQNDENARPEIQNDIDTSSYEVIYLGYPIWWGTAPKIILTFLDNHDLKGKTIIPFCTSGSSSIDASVDYFKEHYKDFTFKNGKRLSSKEEVTNWLKGE